MDDLISRQAALDHLRKRLIQTANHNVGFLCDAGSTFEDASERVKTWLDEVPSEVKHGEWTEREVDADGRAIDEWQSAKCSACGLYHTTPYLYYFDEFKYCPNCGAIMDGETCNNAEEKLQ